MSKIFKFQITVEHNEKILWLAYKNGAINLNDLANKRCKIIGSALRNAINKYISKQYTEPKEVKEFIDSNKNKYTINISWSDENSGYIAIVSEFKNLFAFGKTYEEALKEVQVALEGYIETCKKNNIPLPEKINK